MRSSWAVRTFSEPRTHWRSEIVSGASGIVPEDVLPNHAGQLFRAVSQKGVSIELFLCYA